MKRFKKFRKTRAERFVQIVKGVLRQIPLFNETENDSLSIEFEERIAVLKDRNAQAVFDAYYLPKAINAILKEDGYLTTPKSAAPRANAMLNHDLANGVLDEFYRFKTVQE